jgi:NADPH2:quinone reductase
LVPADVPEPAAAGGEVVVDVALANITFIETQLRAGTAPAPMLPELPVVLGNGVGGTVGDRTVVASLAGSGGYAERAVAAPDAVLDVPDGVELDDALALLADGRTATLLVDLAVPRAGETVLVEAAAGGVGSLLVQLARNAGARVVALAGGERKLAVARELGADRAIDYTEPGWAAAAGPVDVVFDGVGGAIGEAAYELLRAGGRFCPFGLAGGSFSRVEPRDGVEIVRMSAPSPAERAALSRRALAEAAAGRLRPVVGQRFALEDAAAAHAAIEARATIGKTLLVVA